MTFKAWHEYAYFMNQFRENVPIKRNNAVYELCAYDVNHNPTTEYTLVLCHGFAESAFAWAFMILELYEKYRIIAYDMRGHGLTNRDNDVYDISMYTSELEQVLEHFEAKNIILVGHSMGGAVANNFVLNNPSKILLSVLVSTSAEFVPIPVPKKAIEKVPEHLIPDWIVKNSIDLAIKFNLTSKCPKDLVQALKDQSYDVSLTVVKEAIANTLLPWDAKELNSISIPVLIMVGDHDLVTPVFASKNLNKQIPNSRLIIIKNASHAVQIEKYDEIAFYIDDFITWYNERK